MKTTSYKIIIFCMVAGFFLSMNHAFAQRYRSRDQNQDNEPEISQDSFENETFAQRLVKGANFWVGLQPGYIDISPILGYRLTPNLQAGIGGTYIYFNGLEPYYDALGNLQYYRIEGNMYGARVYAEYDFGKNALAKRSKFFAHAEYEEMNVSNPSAITGLPERTWYYSEYVGLGYRTGLGKGVYLNASVLFNINYDEFANINPNGSPIIERIGITF